VKRLAPNHRLRSTLADGSYWLYTYDSLEKSATNSMAYATYF